MTTMTAFNNIFFYLIFFVITHFNIFQLCIDIFFIIILKIFLILLYYPYFIITMMLLYCLLVLFNYKYLFVLDHICKPDKIKLFSLQGSVFVFLYLIIIYIFFFLKNNLNSSYIYVWNVSSKELFYSLDLVFGWDTITMFFLLLTAMIFPLIFIYLNFIKKNYFNIYEFYYYTDFFILLFTIYFFLVLTFLSVNFFYFFLFFESSLICLFLLINFGGSQKKKYHASYSLFFFTAFGSILILLALLILFVNYKTLNLEILINEKINLNLQKILVLLLFFGFAVKIPILPFYNWLPEAHVEASAVGSVLLASILLKVGSYGILRFILPLFKEGLIFFFYFFSIFCIMSIIISSILALLQTDLKKIIAYSSISHMNYITLGLISNDVTSIIGSIYYMISHAFISAALFFIIGIIYEASGSRDLINLSNFNFYNPVLSFFFFFFNFANLSFPLTSSFISELIILSNLVKINLYIVIILITCLFLSSLYTLWLLHNLLFNKLFVQQKIVFLQINDALILFFLFTLVLIFGIVPTVFLADLELNLLMYIKFNYII